MLNSGKDFLRLGIFVLLTLTFVEPLIRSLIGYFKSGIKDRAWFLHPLACLTTVLIYGTLVLKYGTRRLCEFAIKRT